MKFAKSAVVTALASLAFSVSAQATTLVITYSGVVSSGIDVTGVFGQAGQDLTGLSYTSVYSLIEPTPGAVVFTDGTSSTTYGGTAYDVPSPISATLTINGVTLSVGGLYIGVVGRENGLPGDIGYDLLFHEAQDYTAGTINETNNLVYNVIQSYTNNFLGAGDYTTSLNYTVQAGDEASGGFQFFTGNVASGAGPINAYGNLTPQTVNVAGITISAVPEPATWGMMFIGFGVLGAMSRRKKVTTRVRYHLN
jgi:hypothetical protein